MPCIVADDLTPEQIKAFRLADNKVGEIATWNFEMLDLELETLDFDMSDFGFDNAKIVEVIEDNFEVNVPENPVARRGDIYQLGVHRLMCGDSTNISDVETLLDGNNPDMVITDPPYNMKYEGAGNSTDRQSKRILNDNMPDEEFERFMTDVYKNLFAVMKDGASFYVFYKELGKGVFLTALQQSGLTFKQELIWVKNQLVLGGSKYQNMYEPCLFGCKGKSVKFWYAGRKERSVIESVDLMNEIELKAAIKELLDDEMTDIVRVDKPLKNDLHPTMKPIKLLSKFIRNSSKEKDIVLDLFGGSGSTLIACQQLNRNCCIMEYDPKYIDVIIERWEQLTGERAVLLNGETREKECV